MRMTMRNFVTFFLLQAACLDLYIVFTAITANAMLHVYYTLIIDYTVL
jgi:hypothetical protein